MLPKIWKKFLLAICIIACIYNIMSKLVNRNSLEVNLKSVDDGTTVFNLFSREETSVDENQDTNSLINNIEESVIVEEEVKNFETSEEQNTEEVVVNEDITNSETNENKSEGTKFIVLY